MEFEYKGISYYIDKLQDEPDNVFFKRSWFIIKNEPNDSKELNKLVTQSEIWAKSHFLKCKYDPIIQNKLDEIEKNKLYSK
jgi:hypothetical protein